jgi:2-C-methyl-D-erythritol 2,4-cyclodiphosphate synthase
MRVGIGYDAHALVAGLPLVLGGVNVRYEKGLEGYSDADVLVHAIMDALLGAAGLPDIGVQFPSGDEQYRGISSIRLLERTGWLVVSKGFAINNVDSVLIAQSPKIAPFIDEMRHNIAAALQIADDRVMVKATTTDGLGFTGRGEGMAAQAIALLEE